MLRTLLLTLSHQGWLRHWVETSRISARFTSRFVAGSSLPTALEVCQRLASEKTLATLDHLGENVTSLEAAGQSRDAYLSALQKLIALDLGASVSIKLTQFGLDLDERACRENVDPLVDCARAGGTRVEIDMESSEYVDRTLDIVSDMHARHASVRAVVQAYLYRSEADIEKLNALSIPVRLCKGAYKEPAAVAWPKKADVDANYVRLAQLLLDHGTLPAIASHDEKILRQLLDYTRKRGIGSDQFEFQMLYGIRRDLQRMLVEQGYRLRLYVPYGDAWYPYFMRRLAERPANVLFLAKNLFN
ncbi:MAG: proline dehydrogenase family protein [Acidobacteriota bacterium]|nr:proline dehydrogenase family protein [Acidobacteriota bacterium]